MIARPWARLLLDGDQPQALCEFDGRAGLSPADVGSFGDACHREGTLPSRPGFITDDGKHPIASVFKSSATSGGTTTVAARNRRPHITRRIGAVLLVSSTIG